jgi:hypothetical protein
MRRKSSRRLKHKLFWKTFITFKITVVNTTSQILNSEEVSRKAESDFKATET